MASPLNSISGIPTGLVSLICVPLAAIVLMLPMHRVLTPLWPSGIQEYILTDGSTRLVQADEQIKTMDQQSRSRPFSAAMLDLSDQTTMIGYIIGARLVSENDVELPQSLPIPDARWWQPRHQWAADVDVDDTKCQLAISQPDQEPAWLDCNDVRIVSMPNQLSLLEKLAVAFQRLDDRKTIPVVEQIDSMMIPAIEAE